MNINLWETQEIDISLRNKILTIKDTGIGIQEEKVKNIFDRYYRATLEQGGFGIGLNIVSKICKDYNIKIVVDSELNESTTFKLISQLSHIKPNCFLV